MKEILSLNCTIDGLRQQNRSTNIYLIQFMNLSLHTFVFQFVSVPAVLDVKHSEEKRKHY